MDTDLYKKLHHEGLISDETLEKIAEKHKNPLFSLHWELKTLLYLGVTLLSTGLGVLIYKNIDTIGHQFILLFIAGICAGCFVYCVKKRNPFSRGKVKSPSSFYDYILLLGCLSLLSFLGYLQVQYQVFGNNYGLATFIPMLILFYVAYEFDHIGVLSMAITNLAIWLGATITPYTMLSNGFNSSDPLIIPYLFLGMLLLAAAYLSERYNFKKHFKFTYHNFGLNISFLALLTGYFSFYENSLSFLWLITVLILGYVLYKDAFRSKSFYFLLLITLYTYVAISTLIVRVLFSMDSELAFVIGLLYFIGSAIGLIIALIHLNKKIKEI
ncbi:F0F1-type ATP synthase assembly protein I [Pedobacter cryoconitis]|uniref:F0F1-type ATP synthase assembly protein I n=1 Tax=Pedobacter cryoconitis TaxID=188932 RepID=A0A7W9DY22_9SPHI|nr:DUF2157 domain-containing protein [Pedobacter cryoconitis]MBB5635543.1 F0F1-type ATP synthase assembly protein I [Pedobacter cryoconitis]